MAATDSHHTESPKRSLFARLWYDKETRQVIIQIITMLAIMLVVGYMIRNLLTNLDNIGKGLSFAFLLDEAKYDIGVSLISYTSEDTHLRAALVGLLNTLTVAFFGIILATIVGFTLGVLRLSKNFLMNRMVYCYIELVRNVPVLLWILLTHGVIVKLLPIPKKAIDINETFFISNRGFYMPSPVLEPAFWATIIAAVIGIVGTFLFRRYARRLQDETGRILPVFQVSIGLIFGLPLFVFLISGMPLSWDIPALKGFNFKGGAAIKPEVTALTLALALYTSAFIAENVRSGILAVNYGQTEAAAALGIHRTRALQLIIIPQALRVIVPPLTSQYLNLTKNSSLALVISFQDLFGTLGGQTLNLSERPVECMILVMLIYLTISLTVSGLMNIYNNAIKLVER